MKSSLTFGAMAGLAFAGAATAEANLINEFQANPPGFDPSTQTIELLGTANASFTGVLLSIESDTGSTFGEVQQIESLSGAYDANGLLTFDVDDLENPSFTLVLADSFTGSDGFDFDTNDDGNIDDTTGLGTVYDAIGVYDDLNEAAYGSDLGGQDFGADAEPELIFRDSATLAWYAVDEIDEDPLNLFDIDGNPVDAGLFSADPSQDTFGAANPAIPEPASLALLTAGGLLVAGRRRRA
mgnify:CR=1 FL=1